MHEYWIFIFILSFFLEVNILQQTYVHLFVSQVKEPIVCGITSLGYDHMEILGKFSILQF
jgi:hypothetical protein